MEQNKEDIIINCSFKEIDSILRRNPDNLELLFDEEGFKLLYYNTEAQSIIEMLANNYRYIFNICASYGPVHR